MKSKASRELHFLNLELGVWSAHGWRLSIEIIDFSAPQRLRRPSFSKFILPISVDHLMNEGFSILNSYRSRLQTILVIAQSVETSADKMKVINQLDGLFIEVFNHVNKLVSKNPADPEITDLQNFEFLIADRKAELSRKYFGELL